MEKFQIKQAKRMAQQRETKTAKILRVRMIFLWVKK